MKKNRLKFIFVLVFFSAVIIFLYSQTKKSPIEYANTPFARETAKNIVDELEFSIDLTYEQYSQIENNLTLQVDVPSNELTQKYEDIKIDAKNTRTDLTDLNYKIYQLNESLYPAVNEILKKKQKKKFSEMYKYGFMDAKTGLDGKLEGYVEKPENDDIQIPSVLYP